MHLKFRPYDNNATTGVVDTLTEEVLSESSLLTLELVCKRLEIPLRSTLCGVFDLSVVKKTVDCFLEHSLLVADDDVRRLDGDEALKTVVSVDDSSVEFVEVSGCKPSAVELDHRSEIRRDYGKDSEDHPLGLVTRIDEPCAVLDYRCSLLRLSAVSLSVLADDFSKDISVLLPQSNKIKVLQKFVDGLCAHSCPEGVLSVLCSVLLVLCFAEDLALRKLVDLTRVDYDIALILEDGVEVRLLHLQEVAHDGGLGLVEPDMRDGGCKLYVAAALTSDLLLGDLDAAALADRPLVSFALELAAPAFPVAGRTEDAFTEETVSLRTERTIVDGLRLLDFTVGPSKNLLRGRNLYSKCVDVMCIAHPLSPY